ncbi:hypothetical protein F4819DRAFT_448112 [Hypoxylon fuscum]|nr:hypothetical protein F4819DRAFT_448112 [Hypoxylon fuscum]
MDLNTVSDVVEALLATYAAGLEYYTKWQQLKREENHYQAYSKGNPCGGNACALSTSLSFSSRKIREAFDSGADILGDGFATGDETCRETLHDDLERLQARIYALYKATRTKNSSLELFEATRVSESVRISCLAALTDQYKRVAMGRLFLIPRPQQQRSRLSIAIPEEDATKSTGHVDGNVKGTMAENAQITSEPPSPPPTPKLIPDDLQSTCTSATSAYGLRPKNSVFSMFCPEAVKYQVNPRKTIPKHQNCRCGYDWNRAEDKAILMVKDGFQITPRFLGKSHCEGGFGCVLCTSSGRMQTYAGIEDLKDHINKSHTKWQLLHDRDMAGQSASPATR